MQSKKWYREDTLDLYSAQALAEDMSAMISNLGFQIDYYEWDVINKNYKSAKHVKMFLQVDQSSGEVQVLKPKTEGSAWFSSNEFFNKGINPSEKDKIHFNGEDYTINKFYYYSHTNQPVDVLKNSLVFRVQIIAKKGLTRESAFS